MRRAALLRAAGDLVDSQGPDAVSLAAIALLAGVAKSSIYRYFESREDILATLLTEEITALVAAFETALAARAPLEDPRPLATLIARGFAARPRLCKLASVLATVLENNISEPRLIVLKGEMFGAAGRMAAAGALACPAIPRAAWPLAVNMIMALVAGLWPLANPAPHVARAAAGAGHAEALPDFARDLDRALAAMLWGFCDARRDAGGGA